MKDPVSKQRASFGIAGLGAIVLLVAAANAFLHQDEKKPAKTTPQEPLSSLGLAPKAPGNAPQTPR